MSFELNNPNPKAFTWYGLLLAGAAAFGSFLAVKKFVFGDPINQQSLITGAVCSVSLMVGFFIMYKRGKKKQESQNKKDNSVID